MNRNLIISAVFDELCLSRQVTANKLQPTPDRMPHATVLDLSSYQQRAVARRDHVVLRGGLVQLREHARGEGPVRRGGARLS